MLQFLVGALLLLSTTTHAQPVQVNESFHMPKNWDLNPWRNSSTIPRLSPSLLVQQGPGPFTLCKQNCPEWCWAAYTGMMEMYYAGYGSCGPNQCLAASEISGDKCCGGGGATAICSGNKCGDGGNDADMLRAMGNHMHGAHTFRATGTHPSESELQSLLKNGTLVGRIMTLQGSGHIDIVTNYSNGKYTVADSISGWMSLPWSDPVNGGLISYATGATWSDSIY